MTGPQLLGQPLDGKLSGMSIEDENWEGLSSSPPKRKREADEGKLSSSAKKIRKKKRKISKDDDDVDTENHINLAFSRLDPQLLADLLAKQTKRFAPELSVMELEEKRIPGRGFLKFHNPS